MIVGCCNNIRLGGPCTRCGGPNHSPRSCDEEQVKERERWERVFAQIAQREALQKTEGDDPTI